MTDQKASRTKWFLEPALIISLMALVFSGGALIVSYLQYGTNQNQYAINQNQYAINQERLDITKNQIEADRIAALPKAILECRLQSREIDIDTISESSVGVPVRCKITNTGAVSLSFTRVSTVSFYSPDPHDISLNRGIESVEWNISGWDAQVDIDLPATLNAREPMYFNTFARLPIEINVNRDGIKKFQDLRKCMSNESEAIHCFKDVYGRSLVNILYGGNNYNLRGDLGSVNGAGIQLTLFNGTNLVDEIDFRDLGGWSFDSNIKIIDGLGRFEPPIESIVGDNF